MARHSYVRVRKLHDASGFADYISNDSRQEHLLGTAQYVDAKYLDMFPNGDYWKDLAKYNRLAHSKSSMANDGECVEAREIVFAYPEEFYGAFDPNELNEHMCQLFMAKYKVSVLGAIHLSEKNEEEGTFRNLHTHLVFSERKFTGDIKPTKRNLWRDEAGRLITQQQAEELGKSYFIPKGSIDPFQKGGWTNKDNHLKSREFTNEVKLLFTEEINRLAEGAGLNIQPLEVFDPNGIYLPTTKLGKNSNPELLDNVRASNELVRMHNEFVDGVLYETQFQPDRQREFIVKAQEVTKEFKQEKKRVFSEGKYDPKLKWTFRMDGWLNLYRRSSDKLSNWVKENVSGLYGRAFCFLEDINHFDGQSFVKSLKNGLDETLKRSSGRDR